MRTQLWRCDLVAILVVCCGSAITAAQSQNTTSVTRTDSADLVKLEQQVKHVAERVQPAVVAISVVADRRAQPARHHQLFASGVVITPEGLILSQYHVSHWNDAQDYEKSRHPGERIKVILSDGTAQEAELLGADRTADLSLLRLLTPGKYPFVPVDPAVTVGIGDWVMKLGHPLGYRPGRSPVVRLGRVLSRDDSSFIPDCPMTGGDSGGPLFNVDGRLVGIVRNTAGTETLDAQDAIARGVQLESCSSSALVHARLPAMQRKELAAWDVATFGRMIEGLRKAEPLPAVRWTQGVEVRTAFREVVESSQRSVVQICDEDAVVALGTIVGSDGWIITKASELPSRPKCELPDGQVLVAEVVGVDPAFDVALLRVAAKNLREIEWTEARASAIGTFIAVTGAADVPLAVGVVSVSSRDLEGPFPSKMSVRQRTEAALPEIIGSAVAGRGYWVEFVEGAAAAAGIQPGDVVLTIGGQTVRNHQDLAACVRGRWGGESVSVQLLRLGKPVELKMRLQSFGAPQFSTRADDFPAVFEHDAPVLPRECGGPVVGLDGKTLGITIARVGPHGCMAIPGDALRKLLPELQSGTMADQWVKPELRTANVASPVRPSGKPVTLSIEDLKQKLSDRRDRFKSLLVEYDVIAEAQVDPRLMMAWKLHSVRDYQATHVIAFSGKQRFTQVNLPEVQVKYAPQDLVTADPKAPPAVFQAIERDRRDAAVMRMNGRFGHLFMKTSGDESRYLFDGEKCFIKNEFSQGRMTESPPESFYSPDMYLSGLGLRPSDPRPREVQKKVQRAYSFPENFSGYATSRILSTDENVDDAACIVVEATSEEEQAGKRVKRLDRIWFDSKLNYSPRKWEYRRDDATVWTRTYVRFEEFAPGCWLPLEGTWTHNAPAWSDPELRERPAYRYALRLRRARINDLGDEFFRPSSH